MAAVVVNEYGQPVSRNCTTAGHRKGSLVRTHVPVSYKNWKLVPQKHKDDVWNTLKDEFNIPETSKDIVQKSMAGPWRRFKTELRTDHYDLYPTHEERILHVPPTVREEDWIKFCENEKEEKAAQSRIDHKRKRQQYGYTHCSGHKPHYLVRAELEAENPGVEISPEDVWLKDHTQESGSILPSAQPYDDKLKKAQEEIKEKLDAGLPVEELCALAAAFGKDTRGRARSLGLVSRTQVQLSAPARHKSMS
ncbi:uncharacterized protein LOC113360134 [Papaver somniferum]|uniref:uncharacterized protein LOC113360134 n=1 Tax=Papaver somniferum TaxID=3469 RepID=UPI000E6FDE8D|nr:uncharacterized protein LOC113360134 [Papaver somniferum]